MDTFYKMLTALDQVFKPSSEIIATSKEVKLVENTLHIIQQPTVNTVGL